MNKLTKNKYLNLLIPLIIAAIFCIPFYKTTIHGGSDFTFHISRIKGITDGLKSHNFPVYIYPYANNGYGYGSPLFYCDLFLLFPAVLYLFGLPIIISYKIFVSLLVVMLCYSANYLFRYIFKNRYIVSLICTIMYCLSNINFIYFHLSTGLGNMIASVFLPLLWLSWYKFLLKKIDCWLLLGTSFSLILLSHVLTFTLSVFFFGLFLIISFKSLNKKRIITVIKAMLLAICLSSFFLFPMIEQLLSQKFWVSFLKDSLNLMFLKNSQTSIINLFGDWLFNGHIEKLRDMEYDCYLGVFLTAGIIILYIYNRFILMRNDNQINILFLILMVGLFLNTNIIPLYKISILRNIQFIWRLYIILMPLGVYLFGLLISEIDVLKISKILLVIISLFYMANTIKIDISIFNDDTEVFDYTEYDDLIAQGYNELNDTHDFNVYELGQGEYLPYTNDYQYNQESTNIIYNHGEDAVWWFERNGTTITFSTDFDYDTALDMPLSWYKGYYYQELDDGNILYTKECGYNEYSKRVEIDALSGHHNYKVYYKGTTIQKICLGVSVISLVWTVYYACKNKMFRGLCPKK